MTITPHAARHHLKVSRPIGLFSYPVFRTLK
jgi:hypothetical protein